MDEDKDHFALRFFGFLLQKLQTFKMRLFNENMVRVVPIYHHYQVIRPLHLQHLSGLQAIP